MMYPNARLLVFAKAPEAGQVKTRLIPALGTQGAADLHRSLILHQLRQATRLELCPIELWGAPDTNHSFFRQCSEQFGTALRRQEGRDLGERMAHAIDHGLRSARFVLLIGTDCPTLSAERLGEALAALKAGSDAVFIPAEDGGYVAVGMRRAEPEVFADIPWGGPDVMARTRERLKARGVNWCELEPLWDVDRPEDLSRLDRFALDIPS